MAIGMAPRGQPGVPTRADRRTGATTAVRGQPAQRPSDQVLQGSPPRHGDDTSRSPYEPGLTELPRGWGGQRPRRPGRADQCGATPTGVGATGPVCARRPRPLSYPRRCGDDLIPSRRGPAPPDNSRWRRDDLVASSRGTFPPTHPDRELPPRVRGAATASPGPSSRTGTIPAGAGSSKQSTSLRRVGRDHPRGCGEQIGPGGGAAGHGDHPRGCGEQRSTPAVSAISMGPSPRVRGAVDPECGAQGLVGTIPAGAGSRE